MDNGTMEVAISLGGVGGGAAAGTLAGSVAGPVGGVIGALVGAVAGGVAGRWIARMIASPPRPGGAARKPASLVVWNNHPAGC